MWRFRGNTAPRAISPGVALLATTSAASMSKESRTRVPSAMVKPSPNPGKTYSVLHSDGAISLPSYSNGVDLHPPTKMHFPFVASYASLAVHSCSALGRESAMMSGFSLCFAIARNTSSVKSFSSFSTEPSKKENRCRRTPINAVGLMSSTDSRTDAAPSMSCA